MFAPATMDIIINSMIAVIPLSLIGLWWNNRMAVKEHRNEIQGNLFWYKAYGLISNPNIRVDLEKVFPKKPKSREEFMRRWQRFEKKAKRNQTHKETYNNIFMMMKLLCPEADIKDIKDRF